MAGCQSCPQPLAPYPLKEGVYFNERIMFNNDSIRLVKEEADEDLNN